jgi:hypothetical protein
VKRILPLLAALLFLPGCFPLWGLGVSEPTRDAEADVRGSIPAVEAYYVDHGTYAGVTVEVLRRLYDPRLPDVKIVSATGSSYCVESTVGGVTYSKHGPTSDIVEGDCSEPPPAPSPPPSFDAEMNVRGAVPAIETYFADHSSYADMTVKKLRAYDYRLPDIDIVEARRKRYCVESTAFGETYSKRGPQGDIRPGACG